MRVAILGSRGIPARYGGFETFAQNLASALNKAGHKVAVFCESSERKEPSDWDGVELRYVRRSSVGPASALFYDLRCLWLARRGYDVVYMLGYGAGFACWLPRIHGSKVWINMDGVEWARAKWSAPAKLWFRAMEAISMWTPNLVIADAAEIRNHLIRRHRRMPPCHVIAYGATVGEGGPQTDLLHKWGLEPGAYWLVVCRLEPENHVREIMDGYVASVAPDPLVIVGDADANSKYARSLRRRESNAVRFIGTVFDREQLAALRYHCRGYFHGHSVGGTNPSLLEAMACSNLIIAHSNAFNREVANDTALYFSTMSAIPELIAMSYDEPETVVRLRDAARRRAEAEYSWESVYSRYLRLLMDVGGGAAGRVRSAEGVSR